MPKHMPTSEKTVLKNFTKLRSRLKLIERRYNPDDKNLHFECFAYGDVDLYPQLLSLATDGLKAARRHHAYFENRSLYPDEMFWYDLFLAISAAANKVRTDKAQPYIPKTFVDQLLVCLVQIARYSTINGGDITLRNHEALGNTLLAFYSNDRVRVVRREAASLPAPVKRLVKDAIRRVEELRVPDQNNLKDLHRSEVEKMARSKRPVPTFTWWIDEPVLKGSGNPADEDLAHLRAQGFTTAISLLEEDNQPPRYNERSAEDSGWSIYSIPISEGSAASIDQIRELITLLKGLPEGTKVLVFCESGLGRTAFMGAAYWIAKGLSASDAIARISQACGATDWATQERQRVLTEYERSMKG